MKIISRRELEERISDRSAIEAMERAFTAYSKDAVRAPPVGHLEFDHPPGDLHIKYGQLLGDAIFVVKIATGFYENPSRGLSSSNGLVLVFSAETGVLQALLNDEGYLTDLRTGAAGAVCAKYCAPADVHCIGILGAGIQARYQLDLLRSVVSCRRVAIWARDSSKAEAFEVSGYEIDVMASPAAVAARSNLIVTTTPARGPLLKAEDIRAGTHITAVGADAPGKQELDPEILRIADLCVVDSRSQCFAYGEASHALANGVAETDFRELGEVVSGAVSGRTDVEQITVADLTGLAAQDIEIAKLALEAQPEIRLRNDS